MPRQKVPVRLGLEQLQDGGGGAGECVLASQGQVLGWSESRRRARTRHNKSRLPFSLLHPASPVLSTKWKTSTTVLHRPRPLSPPLALASQRRTPPPPSPPSPSTPSPRSVPSAPALSPQSAPRRHARLQKGAVPARCAFPPPSRARRNELEACADADFAAADGRVDFRRGG